MLYKLLPLIPFLLTPLCAQTNTSEDKLLQEVLRRLDNLEQQNRELLEQVKELRQQQSSREIQTPESKNTGEAPLNERVKVNEQRIAEQAQTKVESSQRFPVQLYGTLLFNAFSGSKDVPNFLGGFLNGPGSSGATVRQTTLGLDFQGPSLPGGGSVQGDIAMDFWAGPPDFSSNWLRIRRAGISLDWSNTSVFVGQDKPLISPYDPNSLAEVGIPALAGSGDLWFWLPQARFQEELHLSPTNGMDVQLAALQAGSYLSSEYSSSYDIYSGGIRPAFEARVAFWHKTDDNKKFEIAPGFHISPDRVNGAAITSRIGSVDWLYRPVSKLEFKGTAYYGENVASLGSLGNGFYQTVTGAVRPVVSGGGWAQLSVPVKNWLTFNIFGGAENDEADHLYGRGIAQTNTFAGNAMFHLSPNVLLSIEAQRLWTRTFTGHPGTYNHYDLAVAYLF